MTPLSHAAQSWQLVECAEADLTLPSNHDSTIASAHDDEDNDEDDDVNNSRNRTDGFLQNNSGRVRIVKTETEKHVQ